MFLCTDARGGALEPLHTSHPFAQSRVIFFGFNELLQRVSATVAGNFFAISSDFTFPNSHSHNSLLLVFSMRNTIYMECLRAYIHHFLLAQVQTRDAFQKWARRGRGQTCCGFCLVQLTCHSPSSLRNHCLAVCHHDLGLVSHH